MSGLITLRRSLALLGAAAVVLGACSSGSSDGETPPEPDTPSALARYADYETVSYDDPEHWVCRPDVDDICDGDLDATRVDADGTLTVEPFEAAADPPIDCFYVYPTISADETNYADWDTSETEEGYVTLNQAARLQSQCRLFAPAYRQRTLIGLGGEGKDDPDNPEDPYADVLDAFKTYMADDNAGRGIVLIGHSQGTGMLKRLMIEEFDPNDDVRELLVGAYLAGGAVAVPEGEIVGGDFENIPLCTSDAEVGCVHTWATFRATSPPPDGSLFGRVRVGGGQAGCTNPAAPGGGLSDLDGYYPSIVGASILSAAGDDDDGRRWVDPEVAQIDTPYVRVPGLVSGLCVAEDGFNYLSVIVNADPTDPRSDDIGGDLTPTWGLHLVDVNLVMGDIVNQVASQAETYQQS